jgi:hypothetical protein
MEAGFVGAGQCVLLALVHRAADPSVPPSFGRIPRRLVDLRALNVGVRALIEHYWVCRGICAVCHAMVMTLCLTLIRGDASLALCGPRSVDVMIDRDGSGLHSGCRGLELATVPAAVSKGPCRVCRSIFAGNSWESSHMARRGSIRQYKLTRPMVIITTVGRLRTNNTIV